MEELTNHGQHDYAFAADSVNYLANQVEPSDTLEGIDFIRTRCRKLIRHVMWQSGLLRMAVGTEFDTLIFLGDPYWPATWIAAALGRMRRKRVLFWTIGWMVRENRVKGFVRTCFMRLAHGLLLYGHFAKCRAIAAGLDPSSLYVVYNSLDYDSQRAAREKVTEAHIEQTRTELFGNPSTPVVICVSRLTSHRRLDELLHAAKMLKDQNHPINVLLVGGGPEHDHLKSLAERLNVKVCFYGPCYEDDDLARLTISANVTVAPGMVGLTAMQSLAFGTPVISHDDSFNQAPESEAILDSRTGDRFRLGDVNDLAATIKKWTSTSFVSPSVRESCYGIIDRFYNPQYQRLVIDLAVDGLPANDLIAEPGRRSQ